MFVRKVMTLLKPNSISKFSFLMEQEVIPMLRSEKGFHDAMSFFSPGEGAVTTISLWDKASSAEAYRRGAFVGALRKLAGLSEGIPKVDTYELLNATWVWFQVGFSVCVTNSDLVEAKRRFTVQPLSGTASETIRLPHAFAKNSLKWH